MSPFKFNPLAPEFIPGAPYHLTAQETQQLQQYHNQIRHTYQSDYQYQYQNGNQNGNQTPNQYENQYQHGNWSTPAQNDWATEPAQNRQVTPPSDLPNKEQEAMQRKDGNGEKKVEDKKEGENLK